MPVLTKTRIRLSCMVRLRRSCRDAECGLPGGASGPAATFPPHGPPDRTNARARTQYPGGSERRLEVEDSVALAPEQLGPSHPSRSVQRGAVVRAAVMDVCAFDAALPPPAPDSLACPPIAQESCRTVRPGVRPWSGRTTS